MLSFYSTYEAGLGPSQPQDGDADDAGHVRSPLGQRSRDDDDRDRIPRGRVDLCQWPAGEIGRKASRVGAGLSRPSRAMARITDRASTPARNRDAAG